MLFGLMDLISYWIHPPWPIRAMWDLAWLPLLSAGLLREQKTNNRVLNRLRSVVERVIAQVKTWRILHTGFRDPLGSYGWVFSSGAGVGVFGCGAPLMNKPQY